MLGRAPPAAGEKISANICRDTATSATLESHGAAVANDVGAELDQFFAQAGQRPRFFRLGHRQRLHVVPRL